jgi:hypothetical protein
VVESAACREVWLTAQVAVRVAARVEPVRLVRVGPFRLPLARVMGWEPGMIRAMRFWGMVQAAVAQAVAALPECWSAEAMARAAKADRLRAAVRPVQEADTAGAVARANRRGGRQRMV